MAQEVSLRDGEPRPDIRGQAGDRGLAEGGGEVDRAGREDLRAGGRLVVGHLRGMAGTEKVRDARQHLDSRRRRGRTRVDLDAVAAEHVAVAKARAGERPRCGGSARDGVARLPLALVRAVVLNADDARLRTSELPPRLASSERL